MKIPSRYNHVIRWLALWGMLLRVFVPAGFMPADVGEGWYLKFCPDGIPVSTMVALFGHEHHHHADESESRMLQCDLGGGLSAETNTFAAQVAEPLPAIHMGASMPASELVVQSLHQPYEPRGPPHLLA